MGYKSGPNQYLVGEGGYRKVWLRECNAGTKVRFENTGGLKSGSGSHGRELRLRVSIGLRPHPRFQ